MKIIILGDKYQKGSKSQGCSGLIKINSHSNILENQYYVLTSSFPKAEVFYIYGFDNKKIISYLDNKKININFIYNEKYDEFNECFSLSLVKEHLDSDTLILSGYNILSNNCFKNFDSEYSQVFFDHSGHSKIGCIENNLNIENIFYDLENKIHSMFYLNHNDAKILKNILSPNTYNAFLFEIINLCISSGSIIKLKKLQPKSIKHYKTINNLKYYEKS